MAKKVSFGAKATHKPVNTTKANEWVNARRATATEQVKRLTIDISASLHTRIKSQCALKGIKMNDAVRELLEKYFPPNG
jgi:predicted DNA binding CopG/RHH family protein